MEHPPARREQQYFTGTETLQRVIATVEGSHTTVVIGNPNTSVAPSVVESDDPAVARFVKRCSEEGRRREDMLRFIPDEDKRALREQRWARLLAGVDDDVSDAVAP